MPSLSSESFETRNSPYLNQFTQPDSIIPNLSNPQTLNRYSYALNNPIRYNDPTGHMVDDDMQGDGNCDSSSSCRLMREINRVKNTPKNIKACETIQSVVCLPKPDPKLNLPSDYTFGNNPIGVSPQQSSPTDELVRTLDFELEAMSLLDLVEDGIQWGRPAYRQVKYAIPLGGYEYAIDGLLQMYDDKDKNLTPAQRIMRGVIRAGESAVTDGLSVVVGGTSAAALQASVPVPFVPAGVGYVVGSYSTSVIVDRFFVNQVNPYIFNNRFLGGP